MEQGDILSLFYNSMIMVAKVAGPMLLASVVIGLIVAIFQAATQIHEQTLTFLPKVIIIAVMMLLLGSTMLTLFVDFFTEIFTRIKEL
ncbi:MAG: flagellar biosynthesis protein FliQ [Ruminococcus sp.]|jgi:flagellar biosynthetic protein FliQ|nr:flagellar biosynthesis protein FliQ [Ruminococcus sp.]